MHSFLGNLIATPGANLPGHSPTVLSHMSILSGHMDPGDPAHLVLFSFFLAYQECLVFLKSMFSYETSKVPSSRISI